MKRGCIGLMAVLLAVGCSNDDTVNPGTWYSYRNPVEQSDVQDPSVYEENGKFYLFSTGATKQAQEGDVISILPIMESEDLTSWQRSSSVFSDETVPKFYPDAVAAAPDIALLDDKYLLYYSKSESFSDCGIGVAISEFPTGPYTNRSSEPIIQASSEIAGVSSPAFVQDGDDNYLVFGNFNGIYLAKLSSNGLNVVGKPEIIATTIFDAPYILKHDGMYYLFATVGSIGEIKTVNKKEVLQDCDCLQVVGRADNIAGPYLNKSGENMLSGGYEILIGDSSKFIGTGHGSVIQLSDGTTWIVYNAYDQSNITKGRVLMLDRIHWVGGWPMVRGQIGSFCSDSPCINK